MKNDINWTHDNDLAVSVAGVFITRNCNMKCSYCRVTNRKLKMELGTDEWIECFSILNELGIKKTAILGGEPTIVPGIDRIVEYICSKTNIDLSVITNSSAKVDVLERLVNAGLKKYSTSVDSVIGQGYDRSSTAKSNRALQALIQAKVLGVPTLTGYLVLSKSSIGQVDQVISTLNDLGVWTYLIPFHHGLQNFWENRSSTSQNAFTRDDVDIIKDLSDKLICMKQNNIMVANSYEYLSALNKHAIDLDWHCLPSTSELRIDADGSMMCCNDIKGDGSANFSVFDLKDRDKYQEFQRARAVDAENCPGCFWPSHFHALHERLNSK